MGRIAAVAAEYTLEEGVGRERGDGQYSAAGIALSLIGLAGGCVMEGAYGTDASAPTSGGDALGARTRELAFGLFDAWHRDVLGA